MKPYLSVDPWRIVETGWNPADVRRSESIFSIGNGRFGQRANFEETYSGDHLPGSYVAGVYYPDKTRVGWWKNGYPEYFAKVLNATNWISVRWKIDGVEWDLARVQDVLSFERVLDMRSGVLHRKARWKTPSGAELEFQSERFCSMASPDWAAIRLSLTVLSGEADIEVIPGILGDVRNEDTNWEEVFWDIDEVAVGDGHGTGLLMNTTRKTGFSVATAMDCRVQGPQGPWEGRSTASKDHVHWEYRGLLGAGERVQLEKFICIVSSLHLEKGALVEGARSGAAEAASMGWESLRNAHTAAWEEIWKNGDIAIEGDDAAQQGIRFNIFHLNQTYRGDDPRLNIGPKGFTGEKYGGASYWDTEAYCLPFFLASHPNHVARQLLLYRFHHLDKAIENAEKLGFSCGAALFPMVTMNGEECHNEWEITFEEIHRNGAIAYAIDRYVRYTGDEGYIASHGLPVLIAIARFWAQRVHWSAHRQAYVMLGVTGPNEYENNVNNNWYTNYIAAWCMRYAAERVDHVASHHPEAFQRWSEQLKLNAVGETADWKTKAAGMCLPRKEGSRVFLQQDGFLDKELLPVAALDPSQRPINQHWSWDRILRSVYIKQADVLQGLYFFEGDFDDETHRENYEFYEPFTVHESSLSPCVHVILAAKLGKMQEAYELYLRTSRLDLDDYNHEAYQGLHITSMAGTWMSVVEGFAGFRVVDGVPCFRPALPANWKALQFRILFRDRLISVRLDATGAQLALLSGAPLHVKLGEEDLNLEVQG
jgi:maltose phosphorylase